MKVYSPNKSYIGVSAGVAFANGVGETEDPRLIEWFKDRGYTVESSASPVETEDAPGMTKNEIMAELDTLGVEYNTSAKKADLLELLEKSKQAE